ncbi:MAG: 4Fe-4S binding protein [Sedimentisphaerales bacterium]|nr:4Fe-4S binding protein [Sedimentisphaerales bacterium]
MAVRNIVKIDEEKCNGCGQCAKACAEGAIQIINGKAKLVGEVYCDGLGACIGHCPQGAITVEKREAAEFDEEATKAHLAEQKKVKEQIGFVCPGAMARMLRGKTSGEVAGITAIPSHLSHWPIQLMLVPPGAPYFSSADLVLAADCVAFAMGDFHNRFLKEQSVVIGCPKLDDTEFYIEKLADILKANRLKNLTVVHMEVPCCFGLTRIAKDAIVRSGIKLSFEDITVDLDGNVKKTEIVKA